jgi:hypothetical protein
MEIATMAGAEVLPIVIEGTDNSGGMWSSVVRNAKGGQTAIEQVKQAMAGLQSGSVSSLSNIGTAARLLANPYVAVTALVLGLGAAGIVAQQELVKVGKAADDIGTKAGNVAGLGDALKKVGGDGDTAITALKNLRSQLDLQSRDGGYLEKLFKLNGSSITDAKGQLKSIEDVYKELTGFILGAKNNTEGLEIASNAFSNEAGPQMKKAIEGGATSFANIARTDLDPLIKQSQEIAKIWSDFAKGNGSGGFPGVWDSMKAGFASADNAVTLFVLDKLGSKQAAAERMKSGGGIISTADAADRASVFSVMEQPTGPYTGAAKRTVTPSNRPDTGPSTASLDRASVAVAKHTAEEIAQAAAVDLGAGALAQMTTQAKLMATALESGITPTAARRAEIKRLADEAGEAAVELAKAKMASEIKFERAAAFMTPDELQIATQLKTIYGTDIPAALSSTEAAGLRVNNVLKAISSTGQDVNRSFFVDFTTNLRNSVGLMDSLKNAGLNALGKISDKLASMGADGLWKLAFPGGSGGLLSLIGLGGGSTGGAATSTGAAGVGGLGGLYDLGGYTGSGGKHQPAGIVHKGEVVFSQDDVRNHGGVNAVEAFRTMRGYADGGVVGGGAFPSIADVSPASGGPAVVMHDNRTINIGEGASQQTVAMVRAELQNDRTQMYSNVIKIVTDAKSRGMIRG